MLLQCTVKREKNLLLLQLKPNKCNVVINQFYETSSTCFGPCRSIIRESVLEYKHYDIMVCPSICCTVVNFDICYI